MNLQLSNNYHDIIHSSKRSSRIYRSKFSATTLIIFILSIAVIPFSHNGSLGVAYAQSDAASGIQLYQNTDFGLALFYPSDWEREQNFELPEGGIVGFRAPVENEEDVFRETLDIVYNNLPGGTTLDDYTDTLLQRYHDNLANFTIIESSPSSLSNSSISSHTLVFNFSDGDYSYQALNIWSVIGDKALIVIYYAEPGKYSIYLPVINKMIDSLKVDPVIFGKPEPGGQYVIPSLGFKAEIPHDWTSIKSGESGNSTLLKAAPLPFADSNSTDRAIMFITLEETRQNQTSNDIASHFLNDSDRDFMCGTKISSASIVNLNGDVKSLESELKCSDGMAMKKIKSYMVASQGLIIFVGYGASSDAAYEKYLADFDESIQRLELPGATNLSAPNEFASLFGLAIGQKAFEINGTSNTIDYATANNSTVFDLALDEDAKRLSFTIQDYNSSDNITRDPSTGMAAGSLMFIRISDILLGPYVVTIDGKVITGGGGVDGDGAGVLTIDDKTDNASTYLILSYDQNVDQQHRITIVGTNVVPEFTLGMTTLIFAGIIGFAVSAFMARNTNRLFIR